jgi:FtsZ-binding cell division protein ZapB
MKIIYSVLFVLLSLAIGQSQTIDELKTMKAAKSTEAADLQAKADALKAEASALQEKINIASGWRTNLSGIVGFNLSTSNKWISNPNPNAKSTGLNLGLTAGANLSKPKYFWNNKLVASKAWQDVDLDDELVEDDLFDNGTVDILNIASLAGYKVMPKLAISGLGEVNTSIGNFFSPGTVDIGVGVTWLPINNMTVVIHPLNYNIKFPEAGLQNVETTGALGAKLRVDYGRDLTILGKRLSWSTTLSSFLPYGSTKTLITPEDPAIAAYEATSFEYTWLNTISFEVWRGIGVGISFGLREAKFEVNDLQSFGSFGLSYGF